MKVDLELFISKDDFDFSFIRRIEEDHYKKFNIRWQEIIKQAISKAGFDPDNIDFLKENMQLVQFEDDKFEHLFYRYNTPEQVRIISIERLPNISPIEEIGNTFRSTISQQYY